jgi:hypothetical protein
MVEAVTLSVVDGAVGEQRPVTPFARVEQRVGAGDVQEGLLLPGKARFRQVLCRRAAAHGDIGIVTIQAGGQLGVAVEDRLAHLGRELGLGEQLADRRAHLGEVAAVVQHVDLLGDALLEVVGVDESAIRRRRGRETARHSDALGAHPLDHLAQRGVLPPDHRRVVGVECLEPPDQIAVGHVHPSRVGDHLESQYPVGSLDKRERLRFVWWSTDAYRTTERGSRPVR